MKGIWGGALLALMLAMTIGTAQAAGVRQVYLNDGGVVACQSAWRDAGRVLVLINRDTLVTLGRDEVDLTKTFGRPATKPARNKRHVARHHAGSHAAAKAAKPLPSADPAPAGAAPEPAPSSAKPALRPTPPPPAAKPAPLPPKPAVPAPHPSRPAVSLPAPAPAIPPALAMIFSTFGTTLIALAVALLLFSLAVYWKVYEKAGEPGWSSLIPLYNLFILVRIAGKPWWWFLLMFLPVVNIIAAVLLHLALAARFGKGLLFGLGLAFLGVIFFPILAFGKAEYQSSVPSPAAP